MVSFIIEELTGPTNPDAYVGRNEIIDAFGDLLANTLRQNTKIKWVHISGSAGTGKSSLLRKLRMQAEDHRIGTGSVEVPFSPKPASQLLTDIKQIIDEIAPEWRGFMRKRRNPEIAKVLEPPEFHGDLVSDQNLQDMVNMFFVDLDEINTKMEEKKERNAIFLDDLDRLLPIEYFSILQVIPLIMKRMSELDYNLLFVTTSHFSADKYLDLKKSKEQDLVMHFNISQFDFKDAELMLRRKGKLVKSQREAVVQASTRVPFDLSLRQLIQLNELDPSNLNAKVITELFQLESDEVELLKELAKSEINYYRIEDIARLTSKNTINKLVEALMLMKSQDGYFIVDSFALWELIAHVFKPIDSRTEAILLLNRLRYQAEISQIPSPRDINILQQHFYNISDHALIFELSAQLADTAKAALDTNLVETAWDLLNLATLGLEKTGDDEKIADFQETLAKGFAKIGHDYFAAKAFEQAGNYYRKANIEWKSVTNYREAGQKYVRQAEKTNLAIYHYAVRSMLLNAVQAYINANESQRAETVIKEAKKMFQGYENHLKFFETLVKQGEN
ncbi:MAG: ATP-binding protein [Candidatus Heimdallarchaeota archaeon]|nr:ATP-binding protein [Candidatus Heimdallarchaeota archaeon]